MLDSCPNAVVISGSRCRRLPQAPDDFNDYFLPAEREEDCCPSNLLRPARSSNVYPHGIVKYVMVNCNNAT